jgi:hypothetical protein
VTTGQYPTFGGEIMPNLENNCANQQSILDENVMEFERGLELNICAGDRGIDRTRYCLCNGRYARGYRSQQPLFLMALRTRRTA